MKYKISKINRENGFIATISIVTLSLTALFFSLLTLSSASVFEDIINRREYRIQANLNADACLDAITLMAVKDYFITGDFYLDQFACKANLTNDFAGNISVDIEAVINDVGVERSRSIKIGDNVVEIF